MLIIEMMDQGMRPDVVTLNVMADNLSKDGKMEEANCFLEVMIQRDVNPNTRTYNTLMDGFCLGCRRDVYSYNILINGYCKDRNVEDAVSLRREMLSEGIRADVTTYSTFGVVEHAMKLLHEMAINNVPPDSHVYTTYIDGLYKNGFVLEAMENPGLTPDVVMYNIMIHGFCKEGQIQKANGLLLDMEETGLEPNCTAIPSPSSERI
ncbi:hypothetical protein CUMW_160450 [Citrus unshiu]|nr:hypothetical protein CUMW_160450 [Citrus unshiu]